MCRECRPWAAQVVTLDPPGLPVQGLGRGACSGSGRPPQGTQGFLPQCVLGRPTTQRASQAECAGVRCGVGVLLSSVHVQPRAPAQPESQSLGWGPLSDAIRENMLQSCSLSVPHRTSCGPCSIPETSWVVSFLQQSRHWVTEVSFLCEILVVTRIAWLSCAATRDCVSSGMWRR